MMINFAVLQDYGSDDNEVWYSLIVAVEALKVLFLLESLELLYSLHV